MKIAYIYHNIGAFYETSDFRVVKYDTETQLFEHETHDSRTSASLSCIGCKIIDRETFIKATAVQDDFQRVTGDLLRSVLDSR